MSYYPTVRVPEAPKSAAREGLWKPKEVDINDLPEDKRENIKYVDRKEAAYRSSEPARIHQQVQDSKRIKLADYQQHPTLLQWDKQVEARIDRKLEDSQTSALLRASARSGKPQKAALYKVGNEQTAFITVQSNPRQPDRNIVEAKMRMRDRDGNTLRTVQHQPGITPARISKIKLPPGKPGDISSELSSRVYAAPPIPPRKIPV